MLPRVPAPEPIVVAHLGAHGRDWRAGVEIDVCRLRDGKLVVAHSEWILSGSRKLSLAELLLTDLYRISIGPGPQDRGSDGDTTVCLDWKGGGDVTLVRRLVQRYRLTDRTMVCSAEPAAVAGIEDR